MWKGAYTVKMGTFPNDFILRVYKAKCIPAKKLFGLECCMPDKAKAEKIHVLILFIYTAPCKELFVIVKAMGGHTVVEYRIPVPSF